MDYKTLPSKDVVQKTIAGLAEIGVEAFAVETGADALSKIKELIPAGASVMNGASVTLEQIGFVDLLKSGRHNWNNLHAAIIAEPDKAKQSALRKQAALSDYYLGSVHALTEQGPFVIASNTGSQLPHVVFTSPNLIFVVSTKKIVLNMDAAMARLNEHVIPLEDQHMQQLYNVHTFPSKIVVFNREAPMTGRKVQMILVNEDLGF